MAEQATERTVVSASPERCFAVVADIERYPDWAADIKEVTVHERDDQGRPSLVSFRAAAFGRSTSYTLAYDYAEAPAGLRLAPDAGGHHHQARRELRLRGGRGRRHRDHLSPRGRAAGPDPRLHQDAGPEPDHVHRAARPEGTGRVLGVNAEVRAGGQRPRCRRRRDQGARGGHRRRRAGGGQRTGCPSPAGHGRRRRRPSRPSVAVVRALVPTTADAGAVGPPVGIGAPGLVDRNGLLAFAPNLPGAAGCRPRTPAGGDAAGDLVVGRERRERAPPWPSTAPGRPEGSTTC